MIYEAFNLSVRGDGWGGVSADYAVVRDYCDRYALDRIGVWRVVCAMLNSYGAARKKQGKRGKK
jgi:hypothetical protein